MSLTYDDAVPSQRATAARQLAARRLPGTFFILGKSDDLARHRAEWQSLLAAGHELASHTIHHPCDCSHDWVPRGYTSQDYDLPRMRAELEQTLSLLQGLGAPEPYTFAYPCGETRVGSPAQSYVPIVSELFLAARGVQARLADPWLDSLQELPAFDGAREARELIALCERAEAEGAWLVLLFHGVGGDHLAVSAQAHAALLEHLAQRRDALWTESFRNVARHVQQARANSSAVPENPPGRTC
ncbi:MAG TPA: polysaccharide deacetylase family protein [Polyangiaceae bacterium]|nr:polysaccharide deacetylase family protein [Polyangiaceae bacterium]